MQGSRTAVHFERDMAQENVAAAVLEIGVSKAANASNSMVEQRACDANT